MITTQRHLLRYGIAGAAWVVIIVAALNLAAHHLQMAWVGAHTPWVYEMRYNTALSFLAIGVGLHAALYEYRHVARIAGIMALSVGGLTLLQYLGSVNLGIDELLFKDSHAIFLPGRMAPNTALAFVSAGICLLLSTKRNKSHRSDIVMELLGCLVFVLGALAVAGYIQSAERAFTWGSQTRMAPQTAFANIVWASGFVVMIWARQTVWAANAPLWLPALLCFIVLLFDLATPLSVAAGIAYIPIIFCGLWFHRPHTAFVFAFIATVLTVLGYFSSPPGPYENWIVLTNRALSIGSIWFVATLVYMHRQRGLRLKGSDNKLRSIVDNVIDGLITIDERGAVESFNPACERIFGYKAAEVIGKNIKMLMPEPYHTEHDGYLSRYVATGNARIIGTAGREVRGRRKDGSIFPMDLSVSAFQLKDGRHFSGIVRDITERKESEKAQEQLRQIQKIEALGQLTGGVAHDFNNIIAVILGNLDFLQERTKDNKELQEFIRPSIEAALHGTKLTQRLLAFGRKQALQPQTISLNALIGNFMTLVHRTLGVRIALSSSFADDLWPVSVDPSQLEAAILNLSVNARDAMPGGGKLTYETRNVTVDNAHAVDEVDVAPGDYVMLAINDTGTGMAPEVMKKAFEPFFTTKDVGKGSGLGLSMVYGFVKQSSGHIQIISELGKGTSIRIYLPRAEGEVMSADKKILDKASPPTKKTKVILVVEDNKDVLKLTSAMVASLGYEVLQAENGDAAITLLDKRRDIDMLLSDVMLPGLLNGPALAKRATQLLPHIKILFNSGYAAEDIFQTGMLEEGVQLISKPFRKRQLAEKIAELLR